MELKEDPLGALSTTIKSTGYYLCFLKSTYCLPTSIRKSNVDKRNRRIKLVLYMGTRCGEILTLENIDAYAYACRGRCLTKEYLIKINVFCCIYTWNIEDSIIYCK